MPGLVLAVLVVFSAVVRFLAARRVSSPWIAPDEMLYGLLGRSLYATGRLDVLGAHEAFLSLGYPAFSGLPLALHDLQLGYRLVQGLQSVVMSLAAVPVFFWGRRLMRSRWALLAAALTLAIPGLAYSGLLMSEAVFYPLVVLVAWAAAGALADPSPRRQALLLAAVVLAVATRVQALVFVPAVLTAVGLDALLARDRQRLRAHWPLAVLAAAALAAAVVVGTASLGGYQAAAQGGYQAGAAARFVAYHAADLVLLCGVLPACATALLFVSGLHRGERSATVRAYLAVAVSFACWFVVEVGVFASEHAGQIEERDLLGVAPLLFLGLALWLDRGAARTYVAAAMIAFAAAALVLTLPYRRFVTPAAVPDSFTFAAVLRLLATKPSLDPLLLIGLPAVGLATAFALLPRRLLALATLLVLAALAAASLAASRQVQREAAQRQRLLLGTDPRWIDHALAAHAITAPVAYVYTGNPDFTAAWANAFWNRSINRIYHPPGLPVGGPTPQHVLRVGSDGVLESDGRPIPDRYLVVPSSSNLTPVGQRIATAQLTDAANATQTLALWQLKGTPRVLSQKLGFQPNGDLYGIGTVHVYNCASGSFLITLLGKTTETVTLLLNGHKIRTVSLHAGQAKTEIIHGQPQPGSRDHCTLTINPTSTLGTTQLFFAPG